MSRRTIAFCLVALIAAGVCTGLGFWQLARLREKMRRNADVAGQQGGAAVPVNALPRDPARARYRPAIASGRFDYEHELVLSPRTNQGSPGVNLVTPMRLPGTDTAILVNRGWVYAPDGATADRKRWREADTATVTGYVETFLPDAGITRAASDPRIVRRISATEVAAKIPYPVAPYYLIATGDSADGDHPRRGTLPDLDEGPHRGYAFQWFAFAVIALGGAVLVVHRERHPS